MDKASSKSVDPDLRTLANEEVEPFHYERTMANVKSQIREGKGKMTLLKGTTIASGIVVIMLLAMVLIPASYSVTIGSLVEAEFDVPTMADEPTWVDDSGNTIDLTGKDFEFSDILGALENIKGIDNQNLSIDNGKASLSLVSSDRSGEDVKREVEAALANVINNSSGLAVKCEDIVQLRGGNALAAISGGRICIAVDEMPDEEIKAMLISACEARGMIIKSVDVQTNEHDGEINRQIRIMGELPDGVSHEHMEMDGFLENLHPGVADDGEEKRVVIIKKHVDK